MIKKLLRKPRKIVKVYCSNCWEMIPAEQFKQHMLTCQKGSAA